MQKVIILIIGLFGFTMGIVVPKISDDQPTTYATDLYKPLNTNPEQQNSNIINMYRGRFESDSNNPLSFEFGELGNLKKYTVVSTYSSDDDNPFKYRNSFLSGPVHTTTRFESLNNPYPLITHSRNYESDKSNIGLSPKSGFIQISSSNTYFDSDTMNKPVTYGTIDLTPGVVIFS